MVFLIFSAYEVLFKHDFKNGPVGIDHTLCAQGPYVLHGLFRGTADNAVR